MPFSLMIVLNLSNRPEYPDKRGLCAGSEGMSGLRKVILRYDSVVQPLVSVKYIHDLPFAMFELLGCWPYTNFRTDRFYWFGHQTRWCHPFVIANILPHEFDF